VLPAERPRRYQIAVDDVDDVTAVEAGRSTGRPVVAAATGHRAKGRKMMPPIKAAGIKRRSRANTDDLSLSQTY